MSDLVYVIAFIIGLQMPTGDEEALVQYRDAYTVYSEQEECEVELEVYGPESIVNEFMSSLMDDPEIVPYPKVMPMCILYDMQTGQYPDYPQFDVPVNKPDDGQSANDRLGRPLS